jgi:branched-subunit amino acid aminotransferase/4-amino-4-deoxychorismate lyase
LSTPVARGEEGEQDEPSAVLPGITRRVIVELADKLGVGTGKTMMTLDDVLNADEVFLTNSSWGVLPVIGVRVAVQNDEGNDSQEQAIGNGIVGTLTAQLHTSYQETVDRETGEV